MPVKVGKVRSKFGNKVLLLTVLFFLTYFVGYFSCLYSAAFDVAERFIRSSHDVQAEFGSEPAVSLSPFGYELNFAGSTGSASFDCGVRGGGRSGLIRINLEKQKDKWFVVSATMDARATAVDLMQAR
ncbi:MULTISPECIES: hypothetical protein [unclassified Duganella]|uniref:hypothetical protein n=1 Tax=unclassified Duganella TaxID=2636909 RepID=UPI0012E3529F|nr:MULTISPECIES: hypothetical protein [unclassified Duganella]